MFVQGWSLKVHFSPFLSHTVCCGCCWGRWCEPLSWPLVRSVGHGDVIGFWPVRDRLTRLQDFWYATAPYTNPHFQKQNCTMNIFQKHSNALGFVLTYKQQIVSVYYETTMYCSIYFSWNAFFYIRLYIDWCFASGLFYFLVHFCFTVPHSVNKTLCYVATPEKVVNCPVCPHLMFYLLSKTNSFSHLASVHFGTSYYLADITEVIFSYVKIPVSHKWNFSDIFYSLVDCLSDTSYTG